MGMDAGGIDVVALQYPFKPYHLTDPRLQPPARISYDGYGDEAAEEGADSPRVGRHHRRAHPV